MRPAIIEPLEPQGEEEGNPEVTMTKNEQYKEERKEGPRWDQLIKCNNSSFPWLSCAFLFRYGTYLGRIFHMCLLLTVFWYYVKSYAVQYIVKLPAWAHSCFLSHFKYS